MDFAQRFDEIGAYHAQWKWQQSRAFAERQRQMANEIDVLALALEGAAKHLEKHGVPGIPMVAPRLSSLGRLKTVQKAVVWSFFDLLYLDSDAKVYLPDKGVEPAPRRASPVDNRGRRRVVLNYTEPVDLSSENVRCDDNLPTAVVALISPSRRTMIRLNSAGNILYRHRQTTPELETVNHFVAMWAFQQIRRHELSLRRR